MVREYFIFKKNSFFRKFGVGRTVDFFVSWKDFNFIVGGKPSILFKYIALSFLFLVLFLFCSYDIYNESFDFNDVNWEFVGGFTVVVSYFLIVLDEHMDNVS